MKIEFKINNKSSHSKNNTKSGYNKKTCTCLHFFILFPKYSLNIFLVRKKITEKTELTLIDNHFFFFVVVFHLGI